MQINPPSMSTFNGLGGTVQGSFFRADDSVDVSKPPGCTPVRVPLNVSDCLLPILTGQAFLFSPNLSWFLLACSVWVVFPYDLNVSKTWQDQLWERSIINHVVVFGYVGFWHVALYGWNWAKRPFVEDREYSLSRLGHNIWYTWLGILHWTAIEVAFLVCYQTGKISYPQRCLIDDPMLLIQTMVLSVLLPNFRDIHFYFAHRLIHTRFLYQRIHFVHHRNTDVEPFSGLCMHPLEHLLYYTCYAPCLVGGLHPFILFWMGVHSVIAPAASHSGYEDHFSADTVHYLHHRCTDCNYGVPQSVPLDVWFGTYRGKVNSAFKPNHDPKAQLYGKPDNLVFNLCWILLWIGVWTWCKLISAVVAASLVSIGPLVLAFLDVWYSGPSLNRRSLFAPFDKDPLWSQILHFGLGTLLSVVPATCLIFLVLV